MRVCIFALILLVNDCRNEENFELPSRIVTGLLKGYNNNARPAGKYQATDPVDVGVQLYIVDIEIDERERVDLKELFLW